MEGGNLSSYSRTILDEVYDRTGLTDMGMSANAGSGTVLVGRSGGGCSSRCRA